MALFWRESGTNTSDFKINIVFMDLQIKGGNTRYFSVWDRVGLRKFDSDDPRTVQRIFMENLGGQLHILQTHLMEQPLSEFKNNSIIKRTNIPQQSVYTAFSLQPQRLRGHKKHTITATLSEQPKKLGRCTHTQSITVIAYRCDMTAGFSPKEMLETICAKLQDAIGACEMFQADVDPLFGQQIEGLAPDSRVDAHSLEIAKLQKTVAKVQQLEKRVAKMEPLVSALEGFRGLLRTA